LLKASFAKNKQIATLYLISHFFINTTTVAAIDDYNATRPRLTPPIVNVLNISPNDINQLLQDLEEKRVALIEKTAFSPYFDYWNSVSQLVEEKTGVSIGFAYTALYQQAQYAFPKKHASGGDFDFFGRWMYLDRDVQQSLVGFRVEQRHNFAQIAPGDLHLFIGSVANTTQAFNTYDGALVELWWEQLLPKNRAGFRIGKIDITSVMNNYAFESQNFYFLNNVFTGHPGWAEPANGLGAAFGFGLTEHLYSGFGLVDANGSNTTSGFNTFGKGEYFTGFEFGYRTQIRSPDGDNFHVFLWHSDKRRDLNIPSDQGISMTLQKNIKDKYLPFFRIDTNKGRASEFKRLLISGIGISSLFGKAYGLLGAAIAYGVPTDHKHGDETIVELFYRIQLTPYSQLTPDIQLIKLKPIDAYSKWDCVASLRIRVAA
jgi:porin